MNKTMVISVLLIVLALGGGFFAGTQYQKSQGPAFMARGTGAQNGGGFRGRFGAGNGNQAFRPVRGEVLSVSDTGMTVKLMDGSSKIVVVSPSTIFMKADSASKADIKTGDAVLVVGSQNSDGSVTASNVQINPSTQMNPSPTGTQPTGGY